MKMKRGFTMVELMVVVAIIAILVSVLIASFGGSVDSARTAQCKANMRNLALGHQAIKMLPTNDGGLYDPTGSPPDDDANCPLAIRCAGDHEFVYSWMDFNRDRDPYVSDPEQRTKILSHRCNFWVAVNKSRDSYVCPEHRRYAIKNPKLGDPLWSYAMNGWFGCDSYPRGQNYIKYNSINRPERLMLFAELPVVPMKVGGIEIQDGNLSDAGLDGALDFKSGEVIGFNHKSGKKGAVGNVVFFDGHVEQFLAPKDKGNITDLTKWLCDGDENMDFDIGFDGESYDKVQ